MKNKKRAALRCKLQAARSCLRLALISFYKTSKQIVMKNFKTLRIWQKGLEIAVKSYRLTSQFPSQEKFSIVSQINRAGISIPSNIAEGSSRKSEKDYS